MLNYFDFPRNGLELRKIYTLRLLLMRLEERRFEVVLRGGMGDKWLTCEKVCLRRARD